MLDEVPMIFNVSHNVINPDMLKLLFFSIIFELIILIALAKISADRIKRFLFILVSDACILVGLLAF